MAKSYKELTDNLIEFIKKQHLFFVATATDTSRVNISPKGCDTLRVVSPTQIVWLNHTGSGNETSAHVQQNSRMSIMWCAFEGAPLILRVYGQAKVIHQADPLWQQYISLFPSSSGSRQIFELNIEMVQTSCGKSVPFMDFVEDRTTLLEGYEKEGREEIQNYWVKKNHISIDGITTNIAELSGVADKE